MLLHLLGAIGLLLGGIVGLLRDVSAKLTLVLELGLCSMNKSLLLLHLLIELLLKLVLVLEGGDASLENLLLLLLLLQLDLLQKHRIARLALLCGRRDQHGGAWLRGSLLLLLVEVASLEHGRSFLGRYQIIDAVFVELELFSANAKIPVDQLHEVLLEVVHVGERDAADLRDVTVRVVCVVEHLGGEEHCGQHKPKRKDFRLA